MPHQHHHQEVIDLISFYSLNPHPEGGYYKEVYRSEETFPILRDGVKVERSACTSIYFLLPQGSKSSLHRIQSDEIWHFYLGGPLTIVELWEGKMKLTTLGPDFKKGQKLQYTVPAGVWFGAFPHDHSPYSFVGCTVSPGFDFADFELAKREDLEREFPLVAEYIYRLT